MGYIYAICNQKGGVGKTTTSINLSASLVKKKQKVLLIDFDPQANSTSGVGLNKEIIENSISDVLLYRQKIQKCIHKTNYNFDIIPATIELAMIDFETTTSIEEKQKRLKNQLDIIKNNYDYILIDCPPSLGLLNINALIACDSIIIPVQCQAYALEGLISLFSTIRKIQASLNESLNISGILLTMYDARIKLDNEVAMEVKKFFKERVYDTIIPQSIKIPISQSRGKPINFYDKNCNATKAYEQLAQEVILKNDELNLSIEFKK